MSINHSEQTTYPKRPLNVLYFGLSGAFSVPPLEALLQAGLATRAVVLPALSSSRNAGAPVPPYTHYVPPTPPPSSRRRSLPLLTINSTRTIVQVASEHAIPVLEVTRLREPATLAALAAYEPDVICVACFSLRIPPEILRLPRLGCLNVHPSLLPNNRGPDPFFWTFRYGETSTGVTIHQMDEGLDTGPILSQEHVEVREGIGEAALEHQCAAIGGALLVRAIHELDSGTASATPQNEVLARANPWPAAEDYTITPDRPARWAYNFACGIASRTHPIHIVTPEQMFRVIAPLGYDETATLNASRVLEGDVLSLQCTPGVFRARIATTE
jgi:methionyl-tRNA formyltransferase